MIIPGHKTSPLDASYLIFFVAKSKVVFDPVSPSTYVETTERGKKGIKEKRRYYISDWPSLISSYKPVELLVL